MLDGLLRDIQANKETQRPWELCATVPGCLWTARQGRLVPLQKPAITHMGTGRSAWPRSRVWAREPAPTGGDLGANFP